MTAKIRLFSVLVMLGSVFSISILCLLDAFVVPVFFLFEKEFIICVSTVFGGAFGLWTIVRKSPEFVEPYEKQNAYRIFEEEPPEL